MRFYAFVNMYMQGIHAGIQAGHCLGRLVKKYGINPERKQFGGMPVTVEGLDLVEFLNVHETFIVLNAGPQANLLVLQGYFQTATEAGFNEFPWASFNESQEALNGALTCVGIVLPERIYECSKALKTNKELVTYQVNNQFSRSTTGRACFDLENADPNHILNNRWEFDLAGMLNEYPLAH